ncbi:Cellulose synthase-like protein e2 [Thalictrum thalictroides]|uniref:Cellulose synthase-like protein e2 n=1 Tax=Thalictrum thalictroides TaxID=46969 RepID=A0A7J6VLF0_THATH|nr:Cellulose synthase-like protein e2 [Thalictrum thalictroides]
MYCNDPMSARQAMCFHLDPQISSSLAFVQYPQTFHNVSKNDIYNTPMRTYINLFEGRKGFGPSDAFLASIYRNQKQIFIENEAASNTLIEEATVVASCTYEEHTKWGKQIGFLYKSVVEDVLTGMVMHCKGWISLYYNPSRPAFLGTGTTNLNASLIQTTRWYSGFLQISFSKFCPLVYQPFQMSILQTMAYLYLLFLPFTSFLVLCHSTIPQLCLFNGIKLYPKASEPWFAIFVIVYLSSPVQHLIETLFITGGSRKLFWNEQRISYFTRSTSNLFACLAFLKNLIGMKEIEFSLTDKSSNDDDEINRYQMDIYNFDVDRKFLLILTTIVILNATSLAVGITRVIIEKTYNEWFTQIFLSLFITVLNYPLLEGMTIRKDKGGIPVPITLFSISFVICLYYARTLVL